MSARLLKDPATINSRIFVGHLQTEEMNKTELEDHFAKYGTVVGSLINRGFGFVQFEEEQSAIKAIQNENGLMFKGRRIDVRPAKKDITIGAGGDAPGNTGKPQGNNQFGSGNTSFGSGSDSFSGGNQSFGAGNQSFGSDQFTGGGGPNRGPGNQNRSGSNDHFGGSNQNRGGGNDQFAGGNQNRGMGNDQFAGGNQNQGGGNDQFGGGGNQNRGGENDQFGPGNQNRGVGNDQFGGGTQNRGGANQNRGPGNQNNQGGNSNQGSAGGAGGAPSSGAGGGAGGNGNARQRGVRGGKNRNKNREGVGGGGNSSFRDRSPLMGKGGRDWDMNKSGDRYDDHLGDRGRGGGYGRDSFGDRGYDDYKGGMRDSHPSFGSLSGGADYPSPAVPEKNDCEIIVVSKLLTEYAEAIEMRLKKLGLTVDLLFPNEDVPLSRVLGNIASRGCLYAVVVTHINQEHRSLTLNILHGLPQEHRNMPVEDAITLIARDFGNYRAGGARTVPLNAQLASDRHPEAVQVLLNMLADNRQLTVLQYDRVTKYLEVKREEQVQIELGDPKDLPATAQVASDPKQAELQSRILNILNSNKPAAATGPAPSPVPAPAPVPPASWGTAPVTTAPPATASANPGVPPSPLLNDPTVQKALDSLLQGNLLKNIGDQQPPSAAPLFAAFSNMGRF